MTAPARGFEVSGRDAGCAELEPQAASRKRSAMNAIELTHVSKVYRRFGNRRQFATLKSALLSGSLVRDLKPDESFTAVQ